MKTTTDQLTPEEFAAECADLDDEERRRLTHFLMTLRAKQRSGR